VRAGAANMPNTFKDAFASKRAGVRLTALRVDKNRLRRRALSAGG